MISNFTEEECSEGGDNVSDVVSKFSCTNLLCEY